MDGLTAGAKEEAKDVEKYFLSAGSLCCHEKVYLVAMDLERYSEVRDSEIRVDLSVVGGAPQPATT